MADMDDFGFDEDLPEEEVENWGGDGAGKGGGRTRMLLLVLLLVVLVAAAVWFFVLAPADGPSPPVKVVTVPKKPIAMPAPPSTPEPASAPTAATPAPAAPDAPPPTTNESTPVSGPTAVPAAPAPTTAMPAPVPAPKEATPVPTPTEATPVPTPSSAKPASAPPMAKTTPAPVVAVGAYTLNAGAYLMQSNVDILSKKIRAAGYEPVLIPVTRKVKMIRLLVGRYPSALDAARKLKEVKKFAPDAFSVQEKGADAVYAGSYVSRDQARAYADRLYETRGLQLQEEDAVVKETLQRVTFGAFATTEEAKTVARQLSGKGISAQPEAVR